MVQSGSHMDDYAVRAMGAGGRVLVVAARTTSLCEEARRRHGTWPTATAALGRALTAAGLLSVGLKGRQSITLRIVGDGPLGGIIAEGRAGGFVRGYVHSPHVHLPIRTDGKLDVGEAVGRKGFIHVTRDLGFGQPYTGSCQLVSGEIGDDLTYYLARSEQVPSLVGLGVLVGEDGRVLAAGGILVQRLPDGDGEADQLEANVRAIGPVSRAIEAGRTPEEMIETALQGFETRILGRQELRFRCTCSRRRVKRLLLSLGPEEVRSWVKGTEVICHFCGRRYLLDPKELAEAELTHRGERDPT